jgi:hypothetical protein
VNSAAAAAVLIFAGVKLAIPSVKWLIKKLLRTANWGEKWRKRASTIYVLLGIIKKGRKFKNEDCLK